MKTRLEQMYEVWDLGSAGSIIRMEIYNNLSMDECELIYSTALFAVGSN